MIDGFFKLNVRSLSLAGIVKLTGKFNSVIYKTLNPVFYFSCRGILLIKKKEQGDKTVYQQGSIFRSKNNIYSPPSLSENDIFSPSHNTFLDGEAWWLNEGGMVAQ